MIEGWGRVSVSLNGLHPLLQIKLLQGAAKAYHIDGQPRFAQWWESVLVLDEREAFELSCQIEPNLGGNGKKKSSLGHNASSLSQPQQQHSFHRKNDSIDSRGSSSSGSHLTGVGDQTDANGDTYADGGALVSTEPAGGSARHRREASNDAASTVTSASSSLAAPESLDASFASSSAGGGLAPGAVPANSISTSR